GAGHDQRLDARAHHHELVDGTALVHAQVDLAAVVQHEGGAAVLRLAMLGEVHGAQHLDAAGDGRVQAAHQPPHRHQLVVDAVEHVGAGHTRAQVDVGG